MPKSLTKRPKIGDRVKVGSTLGTEFEGTVIDVKLGRVFSEVVEVCVAPGDGCVGRWYPVAMVHREGETA
jgi:hypothetical protein